MAKKLDIVDLYSSKNIAELLDKEQLGDICADVISGYESDDSSCDELKGIIEDAMKIAKQIKEGKSTPWPGASNVMYPLITNAAISFAARTYPEIIRNGKVVECAVLGADPTGEKEDRAQRISQHMSAQLLVEDPEWESDTDRLLSCLAVVGMVFKKTFWDEYYKRNRSIMCAPDEIVVNANIKSLETAERITHLVYMNPNDVIARIRLGIFCDIEEELEKCCDSDEEDEKLNTIIEQHCFLDLDEDGYKEPYIVWVHRGTEKVVRILARFDPENVFANDKNEIWRIDPVHYFTDFHFLRSPEGKYHSIGFGQLLGPINDTINTTINQLIDSGTCSNMQSGLLGRGFKSKSGSLYLTPGEWKKVDVSGDDLKNNIFPMPVRDPSQVLFQLLGVMIQTGKELASVSDILQGQEPAQNVPATTVLALIEQGMKVFSAIQKRMYGSLKKEFGKLYRLNRLYLDDYTEYKQIFASMIITKDDYTDQDMDVIPVSDPSMSSDAQRMARARAMMEIISMVPQAGGQVILRNWLEALQTPEAQINIIIPPMDPNQPPAPSPEQIKMQFEQQKSQMDAARMQMEMQLKAQELDLKNKQTDINASQVQAMNAESRARINKMILDAIIDKEKIEAQFKSDTIDQSIKAVEVANKASEAEAKKIEAQKGPSE